MLTHPIARNRHSHVRPTILILIPRSPFPRHSISGTLVSIGTDLSPDFLTTTQKEVITSATTVGALVGGLGAGVGSDMIGRKGVVAAANGVFVIG